MAGSDTRNSNGLDQFCTSLEERPGLSILDFAGANQNTISFITEYGHRLYSDDFVQQLEQCFGSGSDFYENQSNPLLVARFMEAMDFEDRTFDGALLWDSLQFLTPTLLNAVVGRLARIMRPNSVMFAVFHADERLETVPTWSFRIHDRKTVMMASRAPRKRSQVFNNRNLEKLFQEFESVKFFLTRDQLREVLVRR